MKHESAALHVSGGAQYVDDLSLSSNALAGKVVYSPYASARIRSINLQKAKKLKGVHAVLSAADIPAENQMGPVVHDEVCLANGKVEFIGQAVLLIAAESEALCREAEKLLSIEYEPLPAVLTIEQAMDQNRLMGNERRIERGAVNEGLANAPRVINGMLKTGAQEHWYLETQCALCIPAENDEMQVYSSTQHPSETQAIVAGVLGLDANQIHVVVRRLGGAFGGKETQANHYAAWTALLAKATKRPVKIRLSRVDDQITTGKRHPFLINYKAGFNDSGEIMALDMELNSDGGAAHDLSFPILERALFHSDNAYFIPNMRVTGRVWKTNLPPNTAMRGFGAPQAMAAIENIIDRIARAVKIDAAEIRHKNFYGEKNGNMTHYGQKIEHNHLQIIYKRLLQSAQYRQRRQTVDRFNKQNQLFKKGLALTPVKFGISFTTSFLNQAGALVHIYRDGSVAVNHGGVEMGQGLHTKIRRIAAAELGLPESRIRHTDTDTAKVPNTSATAASSGTDLNGAAVKNAIEKLKQRIAVVIAGHFNLGQRKIFSMPKNIVFQNEKVIDRLHPDRQIKFRNAIPICYLNQISLSATGYYRTPNIYFDREKGFGKPFNYYAFGAAVSEVLVDTLTGSHELLRVDILHDAGNPINKSIDLGQIYGGFVQGLGWCTTEEIKYDENGRLLNDSPDTYKIPTTADIPEDFRINFLEDAPNPKAIRKSKAVGEPPFMLALSVWMAIKDAISAIGEHRIEPEFQLPATNEVILLAIEKIKKDCKLNW